MKLKIIKLKYIVILVLCYFMLTNPKLFLFFIFISPLLLTIKYLSKRRKLANENKNITRQPYNQNFKRPVKNRFEINYKDSNESETTRKIKSCWRINDNGYIYIMAFCELRDQPRTFIEDRIRFPIQNLLTKKMIGPGEFIQELPFIELQAGPRGKKYFTDEKGKIREFKNTQFY